MTDEDPTSESPDPGALRRARRRKLTSIALIVLAVVAVALEAYRRRHDVVHSLDRISLGALFASFGCYLVAAVATLQSWRCVMAGLGAAFHARESAAVYFVSQLGKYLPGAVWPVVLQMEAARVRNISRRAMLAGSVLTMVIGCATGLLVACVLLPLSDADFLHRYWWLFVACPLLLALLHPRAMPTVLNRLLVLFRRGPDATPVSWKTTGLAVAWSAISWVWLGAHVAALAYATGADGGRIVLLSTAAISLAIVVGIAAVPLPAGIGVREASLAVILSVQLNAGQALAVVVASRAIVLVADVVLAGAAAGLAHGTPVGRYRGRTT